MHACACPPTPPPLEPWCGTATRSCRCLCICICNREAGRHVETGPDERQRASIYCRTILWGQRSFVERCGTYSDPASGLMLCSASFAWREEERHASRD